MSPYTGDMRSALEGFPRVSGDEPAGGVDVDEREEFSPRERG